MLKNRLSFSCLGLPSAPGAHRLLRRDGCMNARVIIRRIRVLCRQRSELLRDSTRYKNHLTALLDQIFPGFDRVFSKVSGKGSLAALSLCPTPQAVLYTELG